MARRANIRVFISYSHHDKKYLREDSLVGHLRALEQERVAEFWSDERITTGDLWNEEIKARIRDSQIALVLVSQAFLNSAYITKQEIPDFLRQRVDEGMIIFPIILSACEWERHAWLRGTQFLPKGGKTLESNYSNLGRKKELFLEILRDLRRQIDRLTASKSTRRGPEDSIRPHEEAAASVSALPGRAPKTRSRNKAAPNRDLPRPAKRPEGHAAWRNSKRPQVAQRSPRSGDCANPFDLVTANDLKYEEIPHLFVGDYTQFNKISKHFDTVLEGQRGTGKTMILRYMAFETQIRIWTDEKGKRAKDFLTEASNFVGVYCRLEQGVFDRSDLDAIDDEYRRERLFEHRLCLFCLSMMLTAAMSIRNVLQADGKALDEVRRYLALLLQEDSLNQCVGWTEAFNYGVRTIDMRVTEEDIHLGSLLPGGRPIPFNPWLSLSAQVVPFIELLQRTFGIRCPFFMMLDDFDVLSPSQQTLVFRTASARRLGVVCFKYGIMSLGKKVILSGRDRTYREGHDYDHVSLDWTDKGLQTDYKKAAQLMTEKRLGAKSWPQNFGIASMLSPWQHGNQLMTEVKDLMRFEWEGLPGSKRPRTFGNYWSKYGNARYFQYLAQKKIHHRYAGYDTVIDISSGIYRQYLEICSRIVAKALASGWRPVSRVPINAEIQDDCIREYSREMMDSLSVTAGDTTALLTGNIQVTSKHMVTFIESLSQLFKNRLLSNIREPEIFCISVRDGLDKNAMAKAILDVAERESILQRRSSDYTPKTAGGPSLPTYMLNRRLAPRWSLGVRMQGRIEILSSDVVLAAENTKAFVTKMSKVQEEPSLFT